MCTYTLVVDDLSDGCELAGVRTGNKQHNAADLHEPPLACRNFNAAHFVDWSSGLFSQIRRVSRGSRAQTGGTVPGCVGEVSSCRRSASRFRYVGRLCDFWRSRLSEKLESATLASREATGLGSRPSVQDSRVPAAGFASKSHLLACRTIFSFACTSPCESHHTIHAFLGIILNR